VTKCCLVLLTVVGGAVGCSAGPTDSSPTVATTRPTPAEASSPDTRTVDETTATTSDRVGADIVPSSTLATPTTPIQASVSSSTPDPRPTVLLYTRTAGFRHESIAAASIALTDALGLSGIATITSEDPSALSGDLNDYSAIVFLMTSGDAVDAAGQVTLEQYVRDGGGWVGVHSAADTEYDWPFYGELVGAYFAGHPEVQPATVRVEAPEHEAMAGLPLKWQRVDEWYNFQLNPRPSVRVLATVDESTYVGGTMSPDHPVAWCHAVGNGMAFYTALGHTEEAWSDPAFVAHVVGGITSVIHRAC